MRVFKFTISTMTIASFLLSSVAFAQTNNMGFAPNVGVYQKPIYVAPPMQRQNVNYNLQPQIPQYLYNDVNGFKTPNRYALQSAHNTNSSQNSTQKIDDYGIEYYLSIGYGSGTFTGEGFTNPNNFSDPPVNNVAYSLGDPGSLSLGFGVMSDRKFRAEIVYTTLSGLSYGNTVTAYNQFCGTPSVNGDFYFDCTKNLEVTDGGSVETSALMLNFSIPMNDLLDDFFGDFIIPYVGGGFGMAYNKIEDFEVFDPFLYGEEPVLESDGTITPGIIIYDGTIKHFGTTKSGLAWNIELGASVMLSKKTMLDLYYKISDYGTIETKSETFSTYYEYDIYAPDSSGVCETGFVINSETGWCESIDEYEIKEYKDGYQETGSISTTEIGAKLRMLF